MAFSPQPGDAQLSLSVFSGLVTEMSPTNVPEGVSPDCQDVDFTPGGVSSRSCLKKVFSGGGFPPTSPPFPAGGPNNLAPTLSYAKSFAAPAGTVYNLYLDSNGALWYENITVNPGNYTLLANVPPAVAAKSVTAFGREYLAISDGLHPQEVALQWDGTNLDRVTQDGPGAPPTIANLIIPAVAMALSGGVSISRTGNVVTVHTTSAHGLKIGYRAQITGVTAQPVDFIASVVIKNEDLPGIATITTAGPAAHGLTPGNFVSLTGIAAVSVGTSISGWTLFGNTLTITTTAPHNLSPGCTVTIASAATGAAGVKINTTLTVAQVLTSSVFVCAFVDKDDTGGAGGTASLNWPLADTGQNGTLVEVLSCPTPLSFQIQLNYSDGTWTTGAVFTPWTGTFFVATVPTTTSFTYLQGGPDGTSTDLGTVTPFGQVAPGHRQMRVIFLTRNGYTTRPSPPVKFIANGGEYLSVTNLPIGPPNVVARILDFTPAEGSQFFYIPAPAQVNGQTVSSSTQINDNTTASVTLDFSDPTLLAATSTSIPGNDLASQVVIDGALGFGMYADRLLAWGQRNRIQNLLNMGFDGGYVGLTSPLGWTVVSPDGSTLTNGHFGMVWKIPAGANGNINQSFFRDAYGAPIAKEKAAYRLRLWAQASSPAGFAVHIAITISSASTGFTSTATIPGPALTTLGGWVEANFTNPMPAPIPADLLIAVSATTSVDLLIDDISIIYAANPYVDKTLLGSYVNNPEGFDGVTGVFGPSTDSHKMMDLGEIRDTLYLLTQDPGGRLHETIDNGVTEPSGWTVRGVASSCGLLSAFGLTKSQADDSSSSGGEEWMAWVSSSGARIFSGNQPWKISQEIEPDWEAIAAPLDTPGNARIAAWALNDPTARVIYFGLDQQGAGAPSRIYTLNYRELDTAEEIAKAPPIHTGLSGKLVATDHTRKWTRWNLTINGASLMYRQLGALTPVFLAGNGASIGIIAGFGNVYTLDPTKLTDDDYGEVEPYYVTYFMPQHDQELAQKIGGGRKLLVYQSAFISGTGLLSVQALVDSLTNVWPLSASRTLQANPKYDMEWAGGNTQGNRMALKFASQPIDGDHTDNGFSLQRVTAWMRKATHLPVRGAA